MKNIDFDAIDLTKEAPVTEPERQYYYIAKARKYVSEKAQEIGRDLTFCVTTFGCQMNARDSEKLVGVLELIGYKEEPDEEKADFVIYNTCTVRENANLRVYGRLGQLGAKKKKNPHMFIGLCGCMMQEPTVVEKIKKSYRFVDLIFGTHNIYKFAELIVTRFESERMVIDIWKDTDKIVEDLPSERKFSFKSGVNIMFGCNNFCSYCIVPYVRGRERSRNPKDIIREIEGLVADGVVEVMLLGQNVNSYGKNLEEPMTFAQLLQEIEKIEGLERIRFMTSHPKDLSDELIDVMAHSKKICKHLHLPVQSGSSRILQKMNRHYTEMAQSYLFSTVNKKVSEFSAAHPEREIIRLGIGDVTLPLAKPVIQALHQAVDEMGTAEGFHGYGPEQGYPFLKDAIQDYYAERGVQVASDEIFISDGAKSDLANILGLFGFSSPTPISQSEPITQPSAMIALSMTVFSPISTSLMMMESRITLPFPTVTLALSTEPYTSP